MKKLVLIASLVTATLIVSVGFAVLGSNEQPLALACGSGVVDKAQGETFTVKITFKNNGKHEGTWSVNIAFEGESWTWSGEPQTLTLKPCHRKTLTWTGNVPEDAATDSVARLIVYYNDSFQPLNWWIHVVSDAELAVTSSVVR